MNSFPTMLNGVVPVLFGMALLCAVRILTRPGEELAGDLVRLALTVTAWVLIALGILPGGFLMLAVFLMPLLIPILLVGVLPAIVVILLMLLDRHQRSQRQAALWMLTASARRLMPLAPALESFAREYSGSIGRRAQRVAELLRAGWPLSDALDRHPRLVPQSALLAIRLGHDVSALPDSLEAAAQWSAQKDAAYEHWLGRLLYLFVLGTFFLCAAVFAMLKLLPQFQKILWEFGTEAPPVMSLLLGMSRAVACYWWIGAPLIFFLAIIGVFATLSYIGWGHSDLPGIRWMSRRLHTGAVLDALALVTRRQAPLGRALELLTEHYPTAGIRAKLRKVVEDVQSGRDWCESLVARGLLQRADQAVLRSAERVGNLPWAMEEMAASNRRRLAYRLQILTQLLFPIFILVFGAAVALFVIGCFSPLVTLLWKLV